MIRVRRLLPQACWYVSNPCGTPYVGPGGDTVNYSVYMGNSMLISSLTGGPPYAEVKEYQLGFLHQGDRVMGRLRDKDVQHLSAYGDLSISSVWQTSGLYTYAAGTFGPVAKFITTSGSAYVNAVHNIAQFGVDASYEYSVYVPRYKASAYYGGKWVAAQYVPWFDRYVWSSDGKWGYVISASGLDPLRTGYYEDGTTWQVAHYGAVRFFTAAKPGSTGLWYTNSFQLAWDGNGAYINPGALGKRYIANLLPKLTDNSLDIAWMSNSFLQTVPQYCQWEGSVATANGLDNFLQSSTLVGMAGRVFSSNPVNFDWSSLTIDLLKQLKHVDANILLTLVDFASLRMSFESWADILRFMQSFPSKVRALKTVPQLLGLFKKTMKTSANADLSYKYGISPTSRDGLALARGLHNLARYASTPTRRHARRTSTESGAYGSPIQSTNVLTVETDSFPRDFLGNSQNLIASLSHWGMYPSTTMLYDLIPFSFALDWFINFGSVFERVDYNVGAGSTQYFPIQYVIYGSKRKWSPDPVSYMPRNLTGINGTITFTWYDRYLSPDLPAPPVKFDETGPFRSWAEATALIVQKWR